MEFRFCNSSCQLYCISRVDAEEDNQDFRLLDSTVYPLESVMFLLRSKGSFHCCGSYTGKFFILGLFSVYPITTSSTIINTKPIAKPMVLRLLCCPLEAYGISSSTTT